MAVCYGKLKTTNLKLSTQNSKLVLPPQAGQRLLDQPVVVRLQLLAQHARRRDRDQIGHLVLQVAQQLLALLHGLLAGLVANTVGFLARLRDDLLLLALGALLRLGEDAGGLLARAGQLCVIVLAGAGQLPTLAVYA